MVIAKLTVIFTLFFLHGFLAMLEIALISVRRSKVESEAAEGDKRSQKLLSLLGSPHVPLSALQALKTILGVFAAIYAAYIFSGPLHSFLLSIGLSGAGNLLPAYLIIILFVAYLLFIIGELVPTRIALSHPEAICKFFLGIISFLGRALFPIVRLLDFSGDVLFRFVPSRKEVVTEKEIRNLISQGRQAGVIEKGEEKIVSKVFKLGDRPANSIMTPRQDIVWLDINDPIERIWQEVAESPYTYFPLADGDIENTVGIISSKDLSSYLLKRQEDDLRMLAKDPLRLPSSLSALQALEVFKKEKKHFAILIDEFGSIDGILTSHDLMEAIVGDMGDGSEDSPESIRRDDGLLIVDAAMDLDDLFALLGMSDYKHKEHEGYHSLGGFLLKHFGHLPVKGEKMEFLGFIFEILDIDKNRVSRVSILKRGDSQKAA